MTRDDNKQITSIVYNHLNLPTQIVFNNDLNTKINYLYTAIGQKVQKSVYKYYPQITANLIPAPVVNTDYLGGFQYVDGLLQFFPTTEGYVKYTEGVPNPYDYVFNYTDHLGNIRLSYGADPANPTQIKKYEENNYYPFGLKHATYNNALRTIVPTDPVELIPSGKKVAINTFVNFGNNQNSSNIANESGYKYKYNGKEYQDELGLNMYAMDARQYDPAIGRWVVIDPVVHHNMSPYVAFDNNPVYWADPKGEDSTSLINDIWNKSGSGITVWTNNNNGTFSSDTGQTAGTEDKDPPKYQTYNVIPFDTMNLIHGKKSFVSQTGYGTGDVEGVNKLKFGALLSALSKLPKAQQVALLRRIGLSASMIASLTKNAGEMTLTGLAAAPYTMSQKGAAGIPIIGGVFQPLNDEYDRSTAALNNDLKWDKIFSGVYNLICAELNNVIIIYSNNDLTKETTIKSKDVEVLNNRYPTEKYKYLNFGTQTANHLYIFGSYENKF
jgi:RHS repeat-associated protein